MSKLSQLVGKGVRLIVAEDPDAARLAAPAASSGEAESRDLPPDAFVQAQPAPVVRSEVPADVADFAAVYSEAGIVLPAHGYGIDKVAEMLESKRLASLAREVKGAAVMAALEAAGAPPRDVIQDAVLRDRALDAFEAAKGSEVQELRGKADTRITAIKQEIETFLRDKNAEMESLKQAVEAAQRAFVELQTRKRREEDRLHDLVGHFLEGTENPITTGPGGTPSAPAAPTGGATR
jgi:hypothetical protein